MAMRPSKILFLIFLVLYFIVGLFVLIAGSAVHRQATKFSTITGYSLMSGAGCIIALGVIIIVLSSMGLVGALKDHAGLLKFFIGALSFLLVCEFIIGLIVFIIREKPENQLHTKLLSSLHSYKNGDQAITSEWDRLQQKGLCCGVDKAHDWIEYGELDEPPRSCCVAINCTQPLFNGSVYFENGCYDSARRIFFHYSTVLGLTSIFFILVELGGLALAVFVLGEVGHNYGAV